MKLPNLNNLSSLKIGTELELDNANTTICHLINRGEL